MILLLAMACQAPFEESRHDLDSFRILGMGVHEGIAVAAIWSGSGPWHDRSPQLEWSLDGTFLGSGFDVSVPTQAGVLSVEAIAADGSVRVGQVDSNDLSPTKMTVSRSEISLGDDLSIESRRELNAVAVEDSVGADSALRMVIGTDTQGQLRWMSAGGTVLELEHDTADFVAEEIVFDDGDVIERSKAGSGIYTVFVLSVDGAGHNQWLWVDAAMDYEGPLIRHHGRLLPADVSVHPESGLIQATLVVDESGGITLVDVVAVAETEAAVLIEMPCVPSGSFLFEMSWISQGRCLISDVEGARVVMEAW